MAFTYRNIVNRPLTYSEIDSNFQNVEELYNQCQTAVAASAVNGNMYATIAEGLTNTLDGEYFTVPSLLVNEYLNLYRNDNGSEVLVKTYLIPEVSNFVVRDSSDNIEVNTVSLTISPGNPTISTVLTENGDGLIRKSTPSEVRSSLTDNFYLSKIYTEVVNTGAFENVDIDDGTVQVLTLNSNSTLSLTLNTGQSITLHIKNGDLYSLTWPTVIWLGGSPPTLTNHDLLVFWKIGADVFASYGGSFDVI